jgi:hypothetical protein
MTFHDTRAEYDSIAKWLEENDTEIPWEEVMKSDWWVGPADWVPPPKWSMPKPFPRPISPQTVTNLLLAQENHGLVIPCPPAEGENEAAGGEGVDLGPAAGAGTGPTAWEKFLWTLENLELRRVTFKLITPEERRGLVRMAWIEEELRKREVERNRWRVKRQNNREAEPRLKRRGLKRLYRAAGLGSKEAISELKRRKKATPEQIERWEGKLAAKVVRCEEMRKKRKVRSVFWPGEDEMKKTKAEKEEVVEPVDDRKRELTVTRVGPNPRILTCNYFLKGVEHSCLVKVKEVKNFRRGVKFEMEEPEDGGVGGPWEFSGKLPRFLGRW